MLCTETDLLIKRRKMKARFLSFPHANNNKKLSSLVTACILKKKSKIVWEKLPETTQIREWIRWATVWILLLCNTFAVQFSQNKPTAVLEDSKLQIKQLLEMTRAPRVVSLTGFMGGYKLN